MTDAGEVMQMDVHGTWTQAGLMLLAVLILGASTPANACENRKLCVRYKTNQFQDNGAELGVEQLGYLPEVIPPMFAEQRVIDATGVRVTIIRPPPEAPLGLHLDADGCVEFPSQFAAGHNAVIHPDALVGTGQDVRITVNDWSGPGEGAELLNIEDSTLMTKSGDVCEIPAFVSGAEAWCLPDELEQWATMAVATHFINKLDALSGSPLSGQDLDFADLGAFFPKLAFHDHDTGNLGLGDSVARHRFTVAHEMGHWIHSRAQLAEGISTDLGTEYFYPAECHADPTGPDAACDFGVYYVQPAIQDGFEDFIESRLELHGIRSAEYSSGAMVEGFAHFAAAVAFNDITQTTGEFVYWKDIDLDEAPAYQDFVEDDAYRVELPGSGTGLGGTVGWVATQCLNDWATEFGDDAELHPVGVSSEIDWLRFFWAFLTSEIDTPKPEFWEIPKLLAHARKYDEDPWGTTLCDGEEFVGETRVWEPLVNTLASDPGNANLDVYLDRFENLNNTHKVWRDPN